MGLGKTLQTVLFIQSLLKILPKKYRNILILTPKIVVGNWKSEFNKWCKHYRNPSKIYTIEEAPRSIKEVEGIFSNYIKTGGVLIMSHETYLGFFKNESKLSKIDPEFITQCKNRLIGVDAIFIDEAHRIKNDKSNLYKACCEVETLVRVCITGTPLQNNLLEFYTMCSFVNPKKWDKAFFREFYINPIDNGRNKDAIPLTVKLMQRRCFMLTKEMETFVNRKTQLVLKKDLPEKKEYIIKIEMTKLQKTLYKSYLNFLESNGNINDGGILAMVSILGKICNHPDLFVEYLNEKIGKSKEKKIELGNPTTKKLKRKRILSLSKIPNKNQKTLEIYQKKDNSTDEEMNNDENRDTKRFREDGNELIEDEEEKEMEKEKIHSEDNTIFTTQNEQQPKKKRKKQTHEEIKVKLDKHIILLEDWISKNIPKDHIGNEIENSPKMMILYDILQEKDKKSEKTIIFSQFTQTLDMVEKIFAHNPIIKKNQKTLLKGGIDYVRLDGSDTLKDREKSIGSFSNSKEVSIFLISTKAGGIGINLVEANNVILFDVSWNPASDLQAIFRTYRYGQTKEVSVYRLISHGTPEDSIWKRCIDKTWLFHKVIDDQTPKRMINKGDTTILKQENGKYSTLLDDEEFNASLKMDKLDIKNLIDYEPKQEQPLEDLKKKKERLLEEYKGDRSIIQLLTSKNSSYIKEVENHESLFLHDEGDIITEEEKIIALNELQNKPKISTSLITQSLYNPSRTIIPEAILSLSDDDFLPNSQESKSVPSRLPFFKELKELAPKVITSPSPEINSGLQSAFLKLSNMVLNTKIYTKPEPYIKSKQIVLPKRKEMM
jgi:SNF2 family DNA or RNA helicase